MLRAFPPEVRPEAARLLASGNRVDRARLRGLLVGEDPARARVVLQLAGAYARGRVPRRDSRPAAPLRKAKPPEPEPLLEAMRSVQEEVRGESRGT